MSSVVYYTDGAATMNIKDNQYIRGNGGAAMAIVKDNKVIFSQNIGFKQVTNNYCELYAIYMALQHFSSHFNNDDTMELYSDSAYCINMLKENGWIYSWAKNNWTRGKQHKPIENLEIIQKIWNHITKLNVSFKKVKGHNGNYFNEFVDKLAVEAKNKK